MLVRSFQLSRLHELLRNRILQTKDNHNSKATRLPNSFLFILQQHKKLYFTGLFSFYGSLVIFKLFVRWLFQLPKPGQGVVWWSLWGWMLESSLSVICCRSEISRRKCSAEWLVAMSVGWCACVRACVRVCVCVCWWKKKAGAVSSSSNELVTVITLELGVKEFPSFLFR